MKKITFLLILFISFNSSFSQGTDILSAEQFCSGNSQLTFNNIYGGTDFTEVGCLGSIPNASYFYMVIDQPGDLYFNIDQEDNFGNPIDVDFIAWGPFTDLNDANTSITYTDCPTCPNNTGNPTFYPYATDYITDCSYDIAPTETMSILNALPGQVYVVLITNFNSSQGIINFQQTGGLGTTTCSILPVCGNKFYDVGGPTGNYGGDETTTITPYFPGGTVTVDFTLADIPDTGDVLTVYNGPNNTFPVLGTVTGLPAVFTSSVAGNPTGALTFELITDNDANVGTGWEADITCAPPPPPPTCNEIFYDSGGSGGNYVANEAQVTNIFADTPGDIVTVTFTAFNTENGTDVLTVYDGPNTTYPVLGTFSGTTIPGPFTSSDLSGALTFVFTSNATIESSGWTADITCFTPPTCGSIFYDSGGPSGDYLANELETNTFYPDTLGDLVTATFTAFNIESCCDDLYVYDGPNNTYPLLGVFAGNTIPGPFTSTDASGALTFVFDSDSSFQYSGWAANITCHTPVCGTTVYDSGGSGGNYSANESETTTLFPDNPGDLVNVTFTAFNTQNGSDVLNIYDGPNATYPLLGTFSGTTIPGPFTSSDLATGTLTLVFTSNGSDQNSGWAADVTCVPPPSCGTTFYDSGGPSGDYLANELETNTFYPDNPGDFVIATFTAFDTESCCDDLYVYDGPDNTYPLLGVFAGNTIPGPFTSTDVSGALTFVFDSDSSVQYSGWAADITCYNICNLSISDTIYPIGADECSLDYTELVATTGSPSLNRVDVFSENFDGATMPAGWTVFNGTANTIWTISNTNQAGGSANEAVLDWVSSTSDTGNWRLTSPTIVITGQNNLSLEYNQFFDHYSTSYPHSIYVETNVDGAGWVTQSSNLNIGANIGPNTPSLDLSAISGNNLQIRFRMNGNPFGFDYWYIDNILLTADGVPTPPQITWSPITGLYTDSALTTSYAGGNTDTVYAAPNGIQIYTATDINNCTDTVTVTNNRKTWNGSQNSNWYVANNWTPSGVPTLDDCVVIPDNTTVPNDPLANQLIAPIPIPPSTPAEARNLTLEANSYLEIETNTELVVKEWIDVQNTGIFNLKSSSSLIQIEDSAINTGNIYMQRSPNFDQSAVGATEYIYWSSPVANFPVTNISPSSGLIYEWNPTNPANGTGGHGEWLPTSATMNDATGYIIRGLGGTPANIAGTYAIPANTALFNGVPNNGVITKPIFHGNYNLGDYAGIGNTAKNEDDNWNLLGNPYPSAISANAFVDFNTNINGTVYVWPHSSTYSALTNDPFYEDFGYNYDGNDYFEFNNTGSNPPGTNDLFITSGQAFFVLMNHGATSGSNVTFNNSMRYNTALEELIINYDNSAFYRTSSSEISENAIERHRIWLDFLSPNNITNSILVGYITNATNDFDRLYDGYDFKSDVSGFYSIVNNEGLSIQGRALPFIQTDLVPLGVVANEIGSHTIAINTLDGLFLDNSQSIYLEDLEQNIIHNLRNAPYTFNISEGIHNERFILRYTNETLSINDDINLNSLSIIAPKGHYIKVNSDRNSIKSVTVYDLLGRVLFNKNAINKTEFIINNHNLSSGAYIVKAILDNGQSKAQKIVLRN